MIQENQHITVRPVQITWLLRLLMSRYRKGSEIVRDLKMKIYQLEEQLKQIKRLCSDSHKNSLKDDNTRKNE